MAGYVEFSAARNVSLTAFFLTPMLGWVFGLVSSVVGSHCRVTSAVLLIRGNGQLNVVDHRRHCIDDVLAGAAES